MKLNQGEFRLRAFRVMQYANVATFVSAILTVIKVWDLSLLWLLCVPPALVLMYWWDGRRIPEEIDYQQRRNPQFQKLCKDVEEIRDTLHRQ